MSNSETPTNRIESAAPAARIAAPRETDAPGGDVLDGEKNDANVISGDRAVSKEQARKTVTAQQLSLIPACPKSDAAVADVGDLKESDSGDSGSKEARARPSHAQTTNTSVNPHLGRELVRVDSVPVEKTIVEIAKVESAHPSSGSVGRALDNSGNPAVNSNQSSPAPSRRVRISSEKSNVQQSAERKLTGRCSPERLSGETSRQDRRELAGALAHVLRSKLCEGQSIYLEGLGVLFADPHEAPRAYALGAQLAVRKETIAKLNFERAGELSPFIRERYKAPLELGDFFQDVYRHLPLALQVAWSAAHMRFYLGGLIALLRREIVLDGFSHRLSPLCSFFSLHNRHGDSTLDWFAGADIFIHSDFESVKRVEQPKLMERARFESVSEFGEVALGSKRHAFPLNIAQALNDIGISSSRSFYPEIEVIVLERAPGRLAFITSGARHIPRFNSENLGAEFVIDCELPSLAAWPFTVLAALIESVVSHPDPIEHCPLSRPSGTSLVALPSEAFGGVLAGSSTGSGAQGSVQNVGSQSGGLTWSGALISHGHVHEQILLSDGSSVRLLWVTPLLENERVMAERRTPEHMAALLSRKGLMLTARLGRPTVLFRTEIL